MNIKCTRNSAKVLKTPSAQFECFPACKTTQRQFPSAVSYGNETVYIIMMEPYSYGKWYVISPVQFMRSLVLPARQ